MIDTRLLLSAILEVEELLKTFDRKSENEDIIVRKIAKSCRKVILKYRNDPYFFTQDYWLFYLMTYKIWSINGWSCASVYYLWSIKGKDLLFQLKHLFDPILKFF